MKVSLIIPTLNEAESIGKVLQGIPKGLVDEILVVDGHSKDNTIEIVQKWGHKVILQEGKGYGKAVSTGIKHASGDVVVLIDADGSYEVTDIPKLIKCLEGGYDIAYGSRYLPGSGSADDTLIRFIGNKIFTFLLNILHKVHISDSLFLYVATKKKIFETIDRHMKSTNFDYCIEFPIRAHKLGFKYTEIPSFEKKRIAGKSKVNEIYHGFRILWALLRG